MTNWCYSRKCEVTIFRRPYVKGDTKWMRVDGSKIFTQPKQSLCHLRHQLPLRKRVNAAAGLFTDKSFSGTTCLAGGFLDTKTPPPQFLRRGYGRTDREDCGGHSASGVKVRTPSFSVKSGICSVPARTGALCCVRVQTDGS